jgi:rod shape determining protein RodA
VGSGAWFGKGLTNGTQISNYLPARPPTSCSRPGEELGFSAHRRFALFTALLWRVPSPAGARGSVRPAHVGRIASMILFQFVVNVGMVIGVMPITGIPLPFVTHGGASLISLAFGLGVLQSINIRQMRAEW